jgi:hypothetical protein
MVAGLVGSYDECTQHNLPSARNFHQGEEELGDSIKEDIPFSKQLRLPNQDTLL